MDITDKIHRINAGVSDKASGRETTTEAIGRMTVPEGTDRGDAVVTALGALAGGF